MALGTVQSDLCLFSSRVREIKVRNFAWSSDPGFEKNPDPERTLPESVRGKPMEEFKPVFRNFRDCEARRVVKVRALISL